MTEYKLPKKTVIDLMNKVVLKTANKLNNYDLDQKKFTDFKIALSKLAIILLLPDKNKVKLLRSQGISLKNLHIIDDDVSKDILKTFMNLHAKWCEINFKDEDYSNEKDEFFDFDSEERDENVDNMHYTQENMISAKDFMSQYGIDEESLAELNDLVIEVEDFIFQQEDIDLDAEFLQKLSFLDTFIQTFEFSIEFKDIAYALSIFRDTMMNLDFSDYSAEQKNILKVMIISILQDLTKWVEEVIIKQTAQDIHYIDASLLANISQIDIMLQSFKKTTQEEDDLELF